MRTVKQVIVVRKDLQMNKGKFAVQVAHAAVNSYKQALRADKFDLSLLRDWWTEGTCKICLQATDLEHLLSLETLAKEKGLNTYLITDSGVTTFGEPTTTCLAIGPNKIEDIDEITKDLKLW